MRIKLEQLSPAKDVSQIPKEEEQAEGSEEEETREEEQAEDKVLPMIAKKDQKKIEK